MCLGWRCPGHMMTLTVAALGKEKRACTCQSKTDKIIRQSTISLCINNAFHILLYVHYSTIVSHDSNSEVNRKRLPSQRPFWVCVTHSPSPYRENKHFFCPSTQNTSGAQNRQCVKSRRTGSVKYCCKDF